MAFDSPAYVTDASNIDGEQFRRAIGTLLSPAGGIDTPGDCTVAQQTVANMSVQIGIGQVWVPGSSTTTQGPYYSMNKASVTQAINAANATNPRVDLVGVQIIDKAYAGAATTCLPFYVPGTPTATASLGNLLGIGAVPASSLLLAYVLVPAAASSIVTADILNVAGICAPHGYEWSYSQVTSSGSVTSTTESAGTAIVNANAFTPDGGPVLCEFFAPGVIPAAANNASVIISLFEGSTQIGRLCAVATADAFTPEYPVFARMRFTPTVASHAYTVTAFQANGNATVVAGPGGTGAYAPAFVRFTKV